MQVFTPIERTLFFGALRQSFLFKQETGEVCFEIGRGDSAHLFIQFVLQAAVEFLLALKRFFAMYREFLFELFQVFYRLGGYRMASLEPDNKKCQEGGESYDQSPQNTVV